jgi:hypothetical protein
VNGKEYEYYWAAGILPAGVAKISYTFPDGVTTNSVVQGKYREMQHRRRHLGSKALTPTARRSR